MIGKARLIYLFALALLTPVTVNAADFDFPRDVYAIFDKHCFECHGSKTQRSGLRLDQRSAARQGGDSGPVWTKSSNDSELVRRLRLPPDDDEAMPPKGKPRLNPKQIAAVVAWIDAGAIWPDNAPGASVAPAHREPSHPVLAGEAQALSFQKQVLPFLKFYCYDCHDAKSREAGFDLFRAAEQDFNDELRSWNENWEKVSRSIVSGSMPHPKQPRQPAKAERELFGRWFEIELERRATAETSQPSNARLRQLTAREYDNTVRDLTGLDLQQSRVVFPGGTPNDGGFLNRGHEMVLSPSRLMRYLQAADGITAHAAVSPEKGILWSKHPVADVVRLQNPDSQSRPKSHDSGSTEEARAAIRQHLLDFARRAYRRPLSEKEQAPLVTLFDQQLAQGADIQTAARQVLQGILASPQFVYLAEDFQGTWKDIRWSDKGRKKSQRTFPLTHHEVASRLSYFLWATMPDQELTQLAAAGKLHQPEVIKSQIDRMLKDKRSSALATEFAGYWLKLNKLTDRLDINKKHFPEFTDSLRNAMYTESRLLFEEIVREDRSVLILLDSDFTWINAELARFYGLPEPNKPGFVRVSLKSTDRGGLLGMAGVLTLTSHPERHSAVERGAYILGDLLGTPPLPPPANASQLEDVKVDGENLSMREILERHRANARCAGCHSRIDPLGFALDDFDAIGRFRQRDASSSAAVQDVSTLPDGTTINGLAGLKEYLLSGSRKRQFTKQFARQLMEYALTRELQSGDFHTLMAMCRSLEQNGYRPSAAITVLATSDVFLRRAEE